jgi:DNA repair exonuclease SbcCD nuclease subunit
MVLAGLTLANGRTILTGLFAVTGKPYLLTSDQHFHAWSAFSQINSDGINSRLQIILDQFRYAEEVAREHDCERHRMAGDLFHVRGNVKPSVLNPVTDLMAELTMPKDDISGNHDLEGTSADKLGNATQVLDQLPHFNAVTQITDFGDVVMFPWFQDLNELREVMKEHADPEKDAIIHAPVNGVIKGIPDHGLEAQELADMGYRRVFAGHYHNHKVFCDGKVISIGALTHQTWSDPGTKAGFLIVYPDRIEHFETKAPKFVDLNDPADVTAENVAGNYVRLRLADATESEVKEYRDELEKLGALGVQMIAPKKPEATREGFTAEAGSSLEVSVTEFIDNKLEGDDDVKRAALDVLSEVRAT